MCDCPMAELYAKAAKERYEYKEWFDKAVAELDVVKSENDKIKAILEDNKIRW